MKKVKQIFFLKTTFFKALQQKKLISEKIVFCTYKTN